MIKLDWYFSKVLLVLFVLLVSFSGPVRCEDFLAPDAAFALSVAVPNPKVVEVTYKIATGYYMYRERFAFSSPDAVLGAPRFPRGQVKYDETFSKNVETYRGSVTIAIPVSAAGRITFKVASQGCADAGLCYSPQETTSTIDVVGEGVIESKSNAGSGSLDALLGGGRLLLIVPAFVVLGLGLSLTPCVLPMVPILGSIIVGEGTAVSRWRGFGLALAYSGGMAVVYTALGVAAGLAGEGLAASLQNAWVLGAFGVLISAMALSMFGLYELQLPSALQSKLVAISGRQAGGKVAGVFSMGAISALIVGPCVAAPLAGALTFIGRTGDAWTGGAALFALASGMSVPLLLVGLSAGSILPRAGAWMESIKRFFGVLMLAMAIWLVSPVLPAAVQMMSWGILLLGCAFLLFRGSSKWPARMVALGCALLGSIQFAGMATGGQDASAPLAHLTGTKHKQMAFKRVKTIDELDAAIASAHGKTVMLDFYADWCVSCKEMEKFTFTNPGVQSMLAGTVLLQADVTANDAHDKALLKRFGLFGPPGIIGFDREGTEVGGRVIGFQKADEFKHFLARLR